MNETKLFLKFILVLLAFLIITGCRGTSNPTSSIQTNESNLGQQQVSIELKVKVGTGRYNGQIDSNSIEIKLSGTPEPQAFRFNEPIRAKFDTYKLNVGDTVKVNYLVNEYGQNIILELTILSRISNNSQPPTDTK